MRKRILIPGGLVLLKFLLHYFLVSEVYELHRDEFLHLDQANHLAWGYFSTPPFTSWVSWLISALGNSEFWVRFFPALFGALTLVVVWKIAEEMKGNLYASFLAALCILFSPLLRLNGLFQPNSFDVLAWTSVYYFLIRYLRTGQAKVLFWAAVSLGLGFLNKYNIVFLVMGLLPALLLSPQRKIFLRKEFYGAALLALLLILPNLIWQYRHHFPVLYHMHLLQKYHLVHVNRTDFLTDQLFYFLGALPVTLASFYALLRYEPFAGYRFLLWNFIFTLGIFLFFKAKSYYAIGLYPVYIALGAVYLGEVLKTGRKRYLRPVVAGLPVLFLLLVIPLEFPVRTPQEFVEFAKRRPELGMHRWEDGKKYPLSQDFADMIGWKELAEKTEKIYNTLPEKDHVLILCDNYGQAGAINYYSRGHLRADSFHTDYLGWFDLSRPYRHLIRIKNAGNRVEEMQETAPLFESALLADSIANPFAREYKTDIFVFKNARISVNARVKEEIESSQREAMSND